MVDVLEGTSATELHADPEFIGSAGRQKAQSERLRSKQINIQRNGDGQPYVAAEIRHDVGMLAALNDDDFLLDDGEIVFCGDRQALSK